jgi:hypothetical protein
VGRRLQTIVRVACSSQPFVDPLAPRAPDDGETVEAYDEEARDTLRHSR